MKLSTRALGAALCLIVLVATLAHSAPLPVGSPEEAGVSAKRLERLTQTMQRLVDTGELAGTVVMVARKGKLIYAKAFGAQDKAARVPMAEDSIFRIYSMRENTSSQWLNFQPKRVLNRYSQNLK